MAALTEGGRDMFTIHFGTASAYICCEPPFVCTLKIYRFVIIFAHALG